MKQFEKLLMEAEQGEEVKQEQDPQAEMRMAFTRFRQNMIKFLRVLKGTAIPTIDGQSDFKQIFEDYKKLKNFGPARIGGLNFQKNLVLIKSSGESLTNPKMV